jgi:hypothetical protein
MKRVVKLDKRSTLMRYQQIYNTCGKKQLDGRIWAGTIEIMPIMLLLFGWKDWKWVDTLPAIVLPLHLLWRWTIQHNSCLSAISMMRALDFERLQCAFAKRWKKLLRSEVGRGRSDGFDVGRWWLQADSSLRLSFCKLSLCNYKETALEHDKFKRSPAAEPWKMGEVMGIGRSFTRSSIQKSS